ncbi:MAG: sulfotransferase domain-containing protein [Planctomycetota bacterium]
MVDAFETLIFLHIPKAGGNSFLDFLTPHFRKEDRFDVSEGLRYTERLSELETLPTKAKGQLRFVFGHLPFGIHEWLPQQCRYITVLRDPVDRILSHYYFVREQRKHPMHETVMSRRMSISDYVTSGLSGELNNGMVRLLCGRPDADSLRGHGPCQEEDLTEAKRNLDGHFAVVGLLEQMHATQRVVSQVLGWDDKEPVRRNQTKKRKSVQTLRRRDRDAILSKNAMDIDLYRWASDRFQQQCSALDIPLPDFVSEPSVRRRFSFDACKRYFFAKSR